MGSEVKIDFNHFPELLARMLDNIEVILDDAAKDVAQAAKDEVAVRSGADKASIYVSTGGGSTYGEAVAEAESANPHANVLPEVSPDGKGEAVIGAAEDYAIYVEFGTSHMPARPYLLPALESERQKFLDALAARLFE